MFVPLRYFFRKTCMLHPVSEWALQRHEDELPEQAFSSHILAAKTLASIQKLLKVRVLYNPIDFSRLFLTTEAALQMPCGYLH